MKTLRDYAKEHGVKYRTAWNRAKAGKIEGVCKDELGRILIPEDAIRASYVVCYARVSSSEHKTKLDSQAERLVAYANARGLIVREVVKECGSGLNAKLRKLWRVLDNPVVTQIIVEHKDRLTRFGFTYWECWMKMRGCKLVIINEAAVTGTI